MIDTYILMHKDIPCGLLLIRTENGELEACHITNRRFAPFLGNADEHSMRIWWKHRAVPGSRRDAAEVIRRVGCESSTAYLAKNLALSLTDTYWICPADIELSWEDVNLYRRAEAGHNFVVYHSGTSYDPNASLGGQMSKFWDITGGSPVLVKRAYEQYGQQSINEMFATDLHSRQGTSVPFVRYEVCDADDNAILTRCESFTSEKVEFVSAYEVLRSRKLRQSRSDYDQFIDICEENGLDRGRMQEFMDYMTLSDFALSNIDRHLQNFGVLRDADTMDILGPAPLFDSGNSMFYRENRSVPLSRAEVLEQEISSLHTGFDKMLRHVKNRQQLDADRLPTPAEAAEIYSEHGIPESRAAFIAGSYSNAVELLRDFQRGKRISLYLEKQRTTQPAR